VKRIPLFVFAVVLVSACSTTTPINMSEPRRVVGTESSVRVDGEISEDVRPGSPIPITYTVTNHRGTAIAVADIVPETSWDGETRTVTVSLGSEVPGEYSLPRLVRIGPGETKSFTAAARVTRIIPAKSADPRVENSTLLRLKINFLGDTGPFAQLIDIPEKMVVDKKLADDLFPKWLERNEVVYTNAVPVKVTSRLPPGESPIDSPVTTPTRRRRRG